MTSKIPTRGEIYSEVHSDFFFDRSFSSRNIFSVFTRFVIQRTKQCKNIHRFSISSVLFQFFLLLDHFLSPKQYLIRSWKPRGFSWTCFQGVIYDCQQIIWYTIRSSKTQIKFKKLQANSAFRLVLKVFYWQSVECVK